MFRVKICGLTRGEDVRFAAKAGADALGLQMSLGPRKLTPEAARKLVRLVPPLVIPVGVFFNEPLAKVIRLSRYCGFRAVQLHGEEKPSYCAQMPFPVIKAARMRFREAFRPLRAYRVAAYLLDSYNKKTPGGTGQSFDFRWAQKAVEGLPAPVILAGGLNPKNVQEAIRLSGTFGVDVSSGVESLPGIKDPSLVSRFIRLARRAFKQSRSTLTGRHLGGA
jgi:phosphoribosylanthranilate isomerase